MKKGGKSASKMGKNANRVDSFIWHLRVSNLQKKQLCSPYRTSLIQDDFQKRKKKKLRKSNAPIVFFCNNFLNQLKKKKLASANDLFSQLQKERFHTDFFFSNSREKFEESNWRFFICPIFEKWSIKKITAIRKNLGKLQKKKTFTKPLCLKTTVAIAYQK